MGSVWNLGWAAAAPGASQNYITNTNFDDLFGILGTGSRDGFPGTFPLMEMAMSELHPTIPLSQPDHGPNAQFAAAALPVQIYSAAQLGIASLANSAGAAEDFESLQHEFNLKIAKLSRLCPPSMIVSEVAQVAALQAIADEATKIARIRVKISRLEELLEEWKPVAQANGLKKPDQKMRKLVPDFHKLRLDDVRFDLPPPVSPIRDEPKPRRSFKGGSQSTRADAREVFSFFVHFMNHCAENSIGDSLSISYLKKQWEKYYPDQTMDSRMIGTGVNGDTRGAYKTQQRFTLQDIVDAAKDRWPKNFNLATIQLLTCKKSNSKRTTALEERTRQYNEQGRLGTAKIRCVAPAVAVRAEAADVNARTAGAAAADSEATEAAGRLQAPPPAAEAAAADEEARAGEKLRTAGAAAKAAAEQAAVVAAAAANANAVHYIFVSVPPTFCA